MRAHILLVEDCSDAYTRVDALERAGHRCRLASTAESAREWVYAQERVDVLVTDVAFGRDPRRGLGLLVELRESGLRIPIVLMSASADVELLRFAINQGANHLLERPFAPSDLVAAVDRLLERSEPRTLLLERARLTDKERTVASYLLAGLSSCEIAELESNSPRTIRQHITQIYTKCEVSSRAEFLCAVYRR